jgi:hypothetical protein
LVSKTIIILDFCAIDGRVEPVTLVSPKVQV